MKQGLGFSVCVILLFTLGAFGQTTATPHAAASGPSARQQYLDRERRLLGEIEKRPEDAKLYNDLGVVQFYLGKGQAAEASFHKAIKLDPSSADARANLSFHYFQMGN